MKTLLLDQTLWDLCKDTNGNIAVASDPYSIAQDVSSECRVFHGEVYYDTTRGIYYFEQILGQTPPLPTMRAQYIAAALTVPGVTDAQCFFAGLSNRKLTGQLSLNGGSLSAGF